ncbi:sir2 family protein [Vibrio cholerae]|nr:sir2 family protein [Vibrio cholerae]
MSLPYRHVVILTGAGISAESGIQTFRAQDGLWENHRIEDVATPEGFQRDPDMVLEFYNQRRRKLLSDAIQPNPAHLALGKLEKELQGSVTVITQNIDNLHERGGSQNIIHMHGELLKARCPESNQTVEQKEDIRHGDLCHCCQMPARCAHTLSGLVKCRYAWAIFTPRLNKQICLCLLAPLGWFILRRGLCMTHVCMARTP